MKLEYIIKNSRPAGKDNIKGLKTLKEKFCSRNILKIKAYIDGT